MWAVPVPVWYVGPQLTVERTITFNDLATVQFSNFNVSQHYGYCTLTTPLCMFMYLDLMLFLRCSCGETRKKCQSHNKRLGSRL